MNFKEFFILSETLSSTSLRDAWRDQSFIGKLAKTLTGRARYSSSEHGPIALPGRSISNMHHFLDDLMGADPWNKGRISDIFDQIKQNGGDLTHAQEELGSLMMRISRGDYSHEQAAEITRRLLQRHLRNSERKRDTVAKPNLRSLTPLVHEPTT